MRIEAMQKTLTVEPTKKSAYLMYCRKSSESEDKQVESIPDQIRVLTQLAESRGLEIKQVYSESRSAKAPGRIEFKKLVDEIDQGYVKGIFCWKVNRLFRNPEDEGIIRQRLSDGRLEEIITPSKIYLEADSDFLMAVEGAQAQRFIKDLTEDSQRGVNSKIDKGLAPLLAPPGYRNAIEKRQGEKTIDPHPIYFDLMRKLFDLALTGNYTITQLRNEAEKLGIKNSRDKFLSLTQMSVMLRNPFYCGKFVYAGRLYEGKHNPIISVDEFNYLQDILDGRKTTAHKVNKYENPYAEILKCGDCGKNYVYSPKTKYYKNGKSQTFHYFKHTKQTGEFKCTQKPIKADDVDKAFDEILSTIQISDKFIKWASKWLENSHDYQKKVVEDRYKALRAAQDQNNSMINNLIDMRLKKELDEDEFRLKKIELSDQKKKIEAQLASVNQHVDQWIELTENTLIFAQKARQKFANGTLEDKKLVLSVIGSDLRVKDKKVAISIQTPFKKISEAIYKLEEKEATRPKNILPNQAKYIISNQDFSKWVDDGEIIRPHLISELKDYFNSISQEEINKYKYSFAQL